MKELWIIQRQRQLLSLHMRQMISPYRQTWNLHVVRDVKERQFCYMRRMRIPAFVG